MSTDFAALELEALIAKWQAHAEACDRRGDVAGAFHAVLLRQNAEDLKFALARLRQRTAEEHLTVLARIREASRPSELAWEPSVRAELQNPEGA